MTLSSSTGRPAVRIRRTGPGYLDTWPAVEPATVETEQGVYPARWEMREVGAPASLVVEGVGRVSHSEPLGGWYWTTLQEERELLALARSKSLTEARDRLRELQRQRLASSVEEAVAALLRHEMPEEVEEEELLPEELPPEEVD